LESIISTLFIGKIVYHFESLPSTNVFAQELVSKSKPPEGTAISASFQTAGRGQIGSQWESSAHENIIVSIILYPSFLEATQQFELNRAVALAVRDTLQAYLSAPVMIKWPNDIYVNDKKICGILIQNTLQGNFIQNSIVGIGINVNQQHFSDQAAKATSLLLETNNSIDLVPLQESLCQNIEFYYLQLKSNKFAALHEKYLSHLYKYNIWSNYKHTEGHYVFKGKIIGVSKAGLLEILQQDNEIVYFDLKQVQFL
jgi:BirA family transcriptional regulator, biotin operon repressor / biotin---[acetyl-CoA-carboxylase] ligase